MNQIRFSASGVYKETTEITKTLSAVRGLMTGISNLGEKPALLKLLFDERAKEVMVHEINDIDEDSLHGDKE